MKVSADRMKSISCERVKIKRKGKLKGKQYKMRKTKYGYVPRDPTFPVGEPQLITDTDIEEVVADESRDEVSKRG